ncbi:MAG: hypothetical protein ACRDZY_13110, partial [Acidimicrobiales bacterium]
ATVTAPTVAVYADTGEPVFGYLPLDGVGELRRAVRAFRFGASDQSRTFGFVPRRPVYQREGCGTSVLATENPAPHRTVCGFADRLAAALGRIDPGLVTVGREAVAGVSPDWRLGESQLWTSGVINRTAVLPYHRDAFNFHCWSAMPVLRRHCAGGYLRIPEYGAVIPCRDGWGLFFAGHKLVHGVTPMRLTRADGYRFSIVFYALRGMRNCFEHALEAAYAKKRRTEREQDMAAGLTAGEPAGVHTLPPGRKGGLRYIGGRSQGEFGRAEQDPDQPRRADPPPGRPAGFDPSLVRKRGFRMFGGRGQDEFNSHAADPRPGIKRKPNPIGDPAAIEDAYLAGLDPETEP